MTTPNANEFDNEFKFIRWKFVIHADPSFITYSFSRGPSLNDFIADYFDKESWLIFYSCNGYVGISKFSDFTCVSRNLSYRYFIRRTDKERTQRNKVLIKRMKFPMILPLSLNIRYSPLKL